MDKINVLVNDWFSLTWLIDLIRAFKKDGLPAFYTKLQSTNRSTAAIAKEMASLSPDLIKAKV